MELRRFAHGVKIDNFLNIILLLSHTSATTLKMHYN